MTTVDILIKTQELTQKDRTCLFLKYGNTLDYYDGLMHGALEIANWIHQQTIKEICDKIKNIDIKEYVDGNNFNTDKFINDITDLK